jgi:16S rRNA (cytidine1402-2'-O)-methyltransferase
VKKLFLVATPIGNLEDISPRALKTLRDVEIIAAEDTRRTGKLLKHFGIETELTSYFEHNKLTKIDAILERLSRGDVALVSDAGTPALNDPGYELVRAALEAGFEVVPIPGPSAPIAALVVSGLPTDKFLYMGYLPRKSGERKRALEKIVDLPYTLIFLESPHRIVSSLKDILEVLGDRNIAVAREMTKLYEEIFRGTVSQAIIWGERTKPLGEYTLVVDGNRSEVFRWSEDEMKARLITALDKGEPISQLAKELSTKSGWSRREIYKFAQQIKEDTGEN